MAGRIVTTGLVTLAMLASNYVLQNVWQWSSNSSEKQATGCPIMTVSETYDDIGGSDEQKEKMQWLVEEIKDAGKNRKSGVVSVLLTGPCGTGKTLLARAVAGSAALICLAATGADFVDEEGVAKVKALFLAARKQSPAIVIIDECESLMNDESKSNMNTKAALARLLTEMDGITQHAEPVLLIAITSNADQLSKGFIRRLDDVIQMPVPDSDARREIIQIKLKTENDATLDEDTVQNLVDATEGMTGSDIEKVVRNSFRRARDRQNRPVTEDFRVCLNQVAGRNALLLS